MRSRPPCVSVRSFNIARPNSIFSPRVGFKSCQLIVPPGSPLDPACAKPGEIEKAREWFAERDIQVSAIGHYQNNLDPDPAKRKAALDYLSRLLDLGAMMGVKVMCTFAGRDPELEIADNIPAFTAAFVPLAKKAEDMGMKIGFENCPMFHYHPFRGINIAFVPRAWDLMFDAVPSDALGLEYDPSHLVGMLIDPYEIIRRYGKKIVHVHAKDSEVDWSFTKVHGILEIGSLRDRVPGLGDVNWGRLVSELMMAGYTGNLDIEGYHDPIFSGDLEETGLAIGFKTLLGVIGVQK